MNNLAIFNFKGQDVRFVGTIDKPEWIAHDICAVLEIDRTQIRRLDDYQKGVYIIHTPGGKQEMTTVTEPGLYSLIFTSRKPIAKEFQRWVFEEVLPSIRKTGQYSTRQSKDVTKPHLSIDDLERYIAIAERLTKLSNEELRSILEYQLIYLLQSLVPSECQSESKAVDYLYTKILNKVPTEGIKPANIKAGIRDLRHIPMSEVHKILKSLEEMSLGYMKNGLFFKN